MIGLRASNFTRGRKGIMLINLDILAFLSFLFWMQVMHAPTTAGSSYKGQLAYDSRDTGVVHTVYYTPWHTLCTSCTTQYAHSVHTVYCVQSLCVLYSATTLIGTHWQFWNALFHTHYVVQRIALCSIHFEFILWLSPQTALQQCS